MKKLTSKILILSIFVIFASSCKKNDAASLSGNWDYIYIEGNTAGEKQIWAFDGSSKLEITIIKQDTTIIKTGSYVYDSKGIPKDQLGIVDIDNLTDGVYSVQKLKKGQLIIQRTEFISGETDAAFSWKEFTKQ